MGFTLLNFFLHSYCSLNINSDIALLNVAQPGFSVQFYEIQSATYTQCYDLCKIYFWTFANILVMFLSKQYQFVSAQRIEQTMRHRIEGSIKGYRGY